MSITHAAVVRRIATRIALAAIAAVAALAVLIALSPDVLTPGPTASASVATPASGTTSAVDRIRERS